MMIRKQYKTVEERNDLIVSMVDMSLLEDALHTDGNYLYFVSPEEIEPYVLESPDPEPTELEPLQEDNADLWYESMIQSTRVEANETEVANLWYELMMGGDIKCGSLELKSFTMLDIGQKKWWPMV